MRRWTLIGATLIAILMIPLFVSAEVSNGKLPGMSVVVEERVPSLSWGDKILSFFGLRDPDEGPEPISDGSFTVVPELHFFIEDPTAMYSIRDVRISRSYSYTEEYEYTEKLWDVVGTFARPFLITLKKPSMSCFSTSEKGGAACPVTPIQVEYKSVIKDLALREDVALAGFVAIPPYNGKAREVLLRLIAAEQQGCPVTLTLSKKSELCENKSMPGACDLDKIRIEEARQSQYFVSDSTGNPFESAGVWRTSGMVDKGLYYFIRDATVHTDRCENRDATLQAFRARVENSMGGVQIRLPANNMMIDDATKDGYILGGVAMNGLFFRGLSDNDKLITSPQVLSFFPQKEAATIFVNDFLRYYFMSKFLCTGDIHYTNGGLDDEGWCEARPVYSGGDTGYEVLPPSAWGEGELLEGDSSVVRPDCPPAQAGNCPPMTFTPPSGGGGGENQSWSGGRGRSGGPGIVLPWMNQPALIGCIEHVHIGPQCLVPTFVKGWIKHQEMVR